MKYDEFNHKLNRLEQRLNALQQHGGKDPTPAEFTQLLEELHISLEELLVADEELRAQNEELVAAHTSLAREQQRYRELFEFAPDGYLVTDVKGIIQEVNEKAGSLLNHPPALLKGKPLVLFVASQDQPVFYAHLHRLAQEPVNRLEWEMRLRPSEQAAFPALVAAVTRQDPQTGQRTCLWLLRDITRRHQARLERENLLTHLSEERDKLQTLINSITDEIWFCDAEGRLALTNTAASQGVGLNLEPYLFRPLTECLSALKIYTVEGERRPVAEAPLLRSLRGDLLEKVEEVIRHPVTGETHYRQVSASPLVSNGRLIGSVAVVRDITEHKETELALEAAHSELEKQAKQKAAELAYTTASLQEQYEERERVEAEIQQRNRELAALRQAYETLEIQIKSRSAELNEINKRLKEQRRKRKAAEAETKRRNLELATLNTITTAVGNSLDLSEILWTLRRLLSQKLNIPGGAVLFYEESADELYLRASWGLPPAMLAALALFPVTDSYHEEVIREKAVILKEDFRDVPLFLEWELDKNRPDWQSHLAVPLMGHGIVQGVLFLFSQAPAVFSEQHVAFYKNLGHQVGAAIQNARLFAEVSTGHEQLRQLAQQVVSIQEEERHRVSRELHDEAGQALTVLKFGLAMVTTELQNLSEFNGQGPDGGLYLLPAQLTALRRHLAEATALCEKTMDRIRTVAHDLRPAALDDLGLGPALEGFCHDFAERTHLAIRYEGGEPPALTATADICFYRFLQEALTNVAKHAHAQSVFVRLAHDDKTVSLSVRDDGIGFDPEAQVTPSQEARGMGLAGMRERLKLLDGWLEIQSRPGEGACLVAHIPCEVVEREGS